MSENRFDTVVLLSGGTDSTVLIHFLLARSHESLRALHIDYGQLARVQELAAAHRISEYFSVPLDFVSVQGLPPSGTGYVFGRNAFLLTIAAAAINKAEGLLAIGIHGGTDYLDCRPHFVETMQHVLDIYSEGRLRILAPFVNWSKQQVLDYAASAGLPLHLTRSCEADTVEPCGDCLSCRDLEARHARSSTTTNISQ